jgi:hypothetical protein
LAKPLEALLLGQQNEPVTEAENSKGRAASEA